MYLQEVRVLNFRCLRDLKLTLSAGLNVLVGENNIGKTTLLDAVRAALGPAASTGEALRITPEDRHRKADGTYVDLPIAITLVFAGLTPEEQAQFIDILNYNAPEPAKSTAQLNFRWTWNAKTERYSVSRWGGVAEFSENGVPEDVLQTIPVTLLGALRDATAALLPGRNSRLAHLLSARANDADKQSLVDYAQKANDDLEKTALVSKAQALISRTLAHASGPVMGQETAIRATEPEFDRIVQTLRLVIKRTAGGKATGFDELRVNGLGFNNLFFIATVMLELNAAKNALLPVLLVEEPEAHLHPQLQTLLADFLNDPKELHPAKVQALVTTHSPTVAAHVSPEKLRVFHRNKEGALCCASLAAADLTDPQMKKLQRMLDVTKATLLFAKGVILVEGITEALLLPVLARRAGVNLEHRGVSVVPVCGVDFATIARLFGKDGLQIPLAVVTDGDAGTEKTEAEEKVPWQERTPRLDEHGKLAVCDRVKKLRDDFKVNPQVGVFCSDVTLEYTLAAAGPKNPGAMCTVWEEQFDGTPRTLNAKRLAECGGDHAMEILAVWRGICLAETACSKAEFAQAMASRLEEKAEDKTYLVPLADFSVPEYLKQAFAHVAPPSP